MYTSDGTDLILYRPVRDLPEVLRVPLERWLCDHEVPADLVVLGHYVRRDELYRCVSWTQRNPEGAKLRHWRFAPATDAVWPKPFPPELRPTSPRRHLPGGLGDLGPPTR